MNHRQTKEDLKSEFSWTLQELKFLEYIYKPQRKNNPIIKVIPINKYYY